METIGKSEHVLLENTNKNRMPSSNFVFRGRKKLSNKRMNAMVQAWFACYSADNTS